MLIIYCFQACKYILERYILLKQSLHNLTVIFDVMYVVSIVLILQFLEKKKNGNKNDIISHLQYGYHIDVYHFIIKADFHVPTP